MDFRAIFDQGLTYADFLDRYATPEQRAKWDDFYAGVQLSPEQRTLIQSFRREMKVIVSAGAWCGDCINQCPIFERFSEQSEKLLIRYFDRDDHPDLSDALLTCGGRRVPSVLFLSEDNFVCGRYGDRTLAKYRQLAQDDEGVACATGLGAPKDLTASVVQDWLDEFERIQLMLRLSGRLREKHGD